MSDIKFYPEGIADLQAHAIAYINKVSADIRDTAIELCPVDTGTLQSSITIFEGEDAMTKYVGGDTVPYGLFVEMGHWAGFQGKSRVWVPAHSYLRFSAEMVLGLEEGI